MIYQQNEYYNNPAVEAFIPLAQQPRFGTIATILSLLFISGALMTAYSKKSIVPKFLVYTFLSAIGSILFAIAAIFVSNSVGVYV